MSNVLDMRRETFLLSHPLACADPEARTPSAPAGISIQLSIALEGKNRLITTGHIAQKPTEFEVILFWGREEIFKGGIADLCGENVLCILIG